MLKKNQEITLTVTELNALGAGVGKVENEVVFVRGGVPGDVLSCSVIKAEKTYAVARILSVVAPSPDREEDECPARGCGGCVWGCVCREAELAAKRAGVESAFRRAGLPDEPVADVVDTGTRTRYRNKAQYPVSMTSDGGIRIGFYAPRSHRVVEAAECLLQPIEFTEILETIRGFLQKKHISIYDEEKKHGNLRHICLRRGDVSGEIMLILVGTDSTLPHADELVSLIRAAHPCVTGILWNQNPDDTNVIWGENFKTLWGKDTLTDTLCGVRLTLAAPAFYQVNHTAAETLYRLAADMADLKGDETLLDLYCGAGSIGLSMAGRVREVIGIEIVPEAVECARRNASDNGITNASFYCADAADARKLLSRAEAERHNPIRPDVVVLDPPRKGCSPDLLSFLAELAPSRIVYISCNPETLARDTAFLASLGYRPGIVTPVDLFPRTQHVETVVLMSRDKE